MTPLMRASRYDNKEIVERLLPKSTPEEIGQALQVAVKYKSKKVIDVIVDGVDFSKEQLKTIFKSIAIDQ